MWQKIKDLIRKIMDFIKYKQEDNKIKFLSSFTLKFSS